MDKTKLKKAVIVGAGISGLSTAYYLRKKADEAGVPVEIEILEAENRPGGKIITDRVHGFICEGGPNGFLDNRPWCMALAKEIGLGDELYPANAEAGKRFIVLSGRLQVVPESALAFFFSPILSVKGRLRVLAEPFMPRGAEGADETIGAFGRRRIGAEAVVKLLDPMVSGVFAGDVEKLSAGSCFPRIVEMEHEHGSLVRAMLKLRREARGKSAGGEPASGARKAGPAGPGGTLYSFREGVHAIVERLAEKAGDALRTSCRVAAVETEEGSGGAGGFVLRFENGSGMAPARADAVVLAAPAFSTRSILKNLSGEIAAELGEIPYAPMAVVCTGFARAAVGHPLDGYGFLAPRREGMRLLGTLWTSSIFPNRAPGGSVLLRNMTGGAHDLRTPFLDDAELTAVVLEELKPLLGITGKPSFVKIYRWRNAIPQYVVGHGERLRRMENILGARHPGLFLTGNAYRGIAMNDCVEDAAKTAERVLRFLTAE
ncbi:MAG: protoporphyrinogen oxidase [bacterium]